MFIEHLRKAHLDGDCVVESFDVTSLYTNVSIDATLQATSELLLEHQATLNIGTTLTAGGPLTSRFRGYQGSEEGDDAETLARIKINNNLGSAQGSSTQSNSTMPRFKEGAITLPDVMSTLCGCKA
ncbi:hypothetical protein RB195_001303 [Necator americanus]|uniref:Reverse transcriptase domain-containing protein n=1 Tax=Necator americanus TaxID=51031 RepID=A0ABR1DEW5_NECAM